MRRIETVGDLEALYGPRVPAAVSKVARHLTPLYRAWVANARFCILSTVGHGGVHGSPRGDDGAVVHVADAETLWLPDWRGNNRIEALRDIVEDGRVALLFLVPGSGTTVRVNGTAFLTDDEAARSRFAKGARMPATVVVIHIDEVYTQCAKAVIRSGLWSRDDRDTVPTVGQILADMTDGEEGGAEYDRTYVERSKPKLW
ncbi:pyridoxamine 5'-phosphate oxidase family protein [Cognatishimia sp. F0-27]|uniref:pyridoxamine 5'-phosphate oxidase family protein n=1 Tax=Cognatishimia sp. F0-27 TaxID=2816855 RepID=UPI001D0C1046|nr:pyridoxamine 5'-phosphate oxidase family protein [Cognatishimia sp. F0-27]MCC1491970.1 pyridoxamine 5'-phosphate oxidase family protein [Cognatishimia sp. F0-27]